MCQFLRVISTTFGGLRVLGTYQRMYGSSFSWLIDAEESPFLPYVLFPWYSFRDSQLRASKKANRINQQGLGPDLNPFPFS